LVKPHLVFCRLHHFLDRLLQVAALQQYHRPLERKIG